MLPLPRPTKPHYYCLTDRKPAANQVRLDHKQRGVPHLVLIRKHFSFLIWKFKGFKRITQALLDLIPRRFLRLELSLIFQQIPFSSPFASDIAPILVMPRKQAAIQGREGYLKKDPFLDNWKRYKTFPQQG